MSAEPQTFDWLPEGNWVDLGYNNAPTESQLRSQVDAGEHNDAYGDLGCPDCGNVDLFWKTHSSKGQRYRCLICEYSSNWETVKSQGDLTLQKFGLTVDCPLCGETISAYNRASIDSHFRKHKEEAAEVSEAEHEWQEEIEWNEKPKKKTDPEWEDVEWDSETRRCCECHTTEGLTTIQAGTFCYDCLPINLGAEDDYNSKLFSNITKDIFKAFCPQTRSRYRLLQKQLNNKIRLNGSIAGPHKGPTDRYFKEVRIEDTDLTFYIDEEDEDDDYSGYNTLTQESLKRIEEFQKDMQTKYNNPSIKIQSDTMISSVEYEGWGVFILEISMDANTESFAAEEDSVSTQEVLNWINRPQIISESYEFPSEPVRCVYCDSDDITTDGLEADGEGTVWSDVTCLAEDCQETWRDYFRYVDTEIIVPTSLT